jgi:hypothetical protein
MAAKFAWRRDPIHLIGHLENVTKNRTKEIAEKVFSGIVMRTPVDTGSLRASWRVSLNAPDLSRTINKDRNSPLGPPAFTLGDVPLYSKVFISNVTPYVMPIEYGWSNKAPYGMVRVTLASLGIQMNVRS